MTIDLDVLEGLLLYPGATQGPWVASGRYIGTPNHMSYVGEVRDQNGNWTDTAKSRSDAALIVAAVNALPELIAAARERDGLRDAMPDLKAVIGWLQNGCDPAQAVVELAIYQGRIDCAVQALQAGEKG